MKENEKLPHEIKIAPRFYKRVLQTRKKVLGSFLSNRLFATREKNEPTVAMALFPKEKRKERTRMGIL